MNKKKVIICVCRGNIVRSPVAEVLINKKLIEKGLDDKYVAISRGVQGTYLDPKPVEFPNITYYKELFNNTRSILEKLNIELSSHVSRVIDQKMVESACLLLAFDDKTKRALIRLFPSYQSKIYLIAELINKDVDIADPEGIKGKERQERIVTEINDVISQGFSNMISLVNSLG